MEKLNFIERQIDKWTNLSDKKKVSYITGIILVLAGAIIYFGYLHYEAKLTKLENEKISLKNEYTISLNSTISRYDGLLSIEREEKKALYENYLRYVEKNEKDMRDILFYTKKYKKVKE